MKFIKICKHPHCSELILSGAYCDKHKIRKAKAEWHKLYANARWRRMSRQFLVANSECAMCGGEATETDHIQAHKGNVALFWDIDNWQGLCNTCHSKKSARE